MKRLLQKIITLR